MLNYPPILVESCKYCGQLVTLERQGDGRPWHGKLNYWYTADHMCPDALEALRQEEAGRDLVAAILGGVGAEPRSGEARATPIPTRPIEQASTAGLPKPQNNVSVIKFHPCEGEVAMTDNSIHLTEEERQYLVLLLETDLGDTRIEARHTDTPSYRERVRHQEEVVKELLEKLRSASCEAPTLPR